MSGLLVLGLAFTAAYAASSWRVYRNAPLGYSIAYPPGWRIDAAYTYTALGPGHDIRGVAFHIPPWMARGTNLSPFDTAVSVESLPGPCRAGRFLDSPEHVRRLTLDHVAYSVADGEGAGAGNFYRETVYALVGTSPCLAVRYFVHTTNLANYDPGTVQPFDRRALLSWFDRIRRTLVLRRPAAPREAPQSGPPRIGR